jgi:hypothetical protein
MSAATLPRRGRRPAGIDALCARFAGVCQSAVDPLEVCCALEFDGWNDRAVLHHYGLPDVFTLAEEMYRRVPRRPAEPAPPPDPWPATAAGPAVHGLLYGLPTVCFPAASGLLAGPGTAGVLIAASLASWAVTQALAHLAYLRLGRAGAAQAARLLRAGLAAGLCLVPAVLAGTVLAGTVLAVTVRPAAVLFAAGASTYMLAATALIVLGGERLLLAAVAPGVLGAAGFLLFGRPPQLAPVGWAALAATPLLALGLAVARTGRVAGRAGRGRGRHARTAAGPGGGGRLVTAAELRGALPSAGFGLLAAGLLAFPVAAGAAYRANAALLASLPLAMSMGAAEWLLIWFRRRAQRLLRSTGEPRVFAAGTRRALMAALLRYLGVTAALTAAAGTAAAAARLVPAPPAALWQVAAYLALGGALFAALLLQAFGCRSVPLAGCALALAAEIASRGGGAAQLLICGQLLTGLTGYAALVLASPARHA